MPKTRNLAPENDGSDTLILEPRTTITSFNGIPWGIQKVAGGAISAMLYGKDKEAKGQYYNSLTSRKNKEVLVALASQVYSYLNGTISEFADINEYAFRIWTQMSVERKTGVIVGEPIFDVEIYKYVGRVNAQSVEVKDYKLSVAFVGKKDDQFVTPFMNRSLTAAKKETKYIHLEMFTDPRTAPKQLRSKVIGAFPTLIIEDTSYPVKSKIDEESGKITVYIEDNKEEFPLTNENDTLSFISRKSGLKPEIMGISTAFQPVDSEIQKVSNRIAESTIKGGPDFLESLGLNSALEELETKLSSIKEDKLGENQTKKLKAAKEAVAGRKSKYAELKIEFEVSTEDLEKLEQDFQKKRITHDMYETQRVRALTNRKTLQQQLIDLQSKIKGSLAQEIGALVKELSIEEGKEGKV
jgi:hypothetical protein